MFLFNKVKLKLKDLKPSKQQLNWNDKQLKMVDSVANDFDTRISKLYISKTNEIIDGHHRYSILLDKFGGEHEIEVVRISLSKRTWENILLINLPILLLIVLPISIVVQKYKNKKYKKINKNT